MSSYSWVRNDERSGLQKLCGKILCQGPVPEHIGFILDGNRRFAKKFGLEVVKGHRKGVEKFTEILRWCMDLGVKEITAYVFSIENYKRPRDEVEGLMELFAEQFKKLIAEKEKLKEQGLCIQFIGDWSQISENVRKPMAQIMVMTRDHSRTKLNMAFAYTSRNEMARGVESLHEGVKNGDLNLEDIDEDLLCRSFQLTPSRPLNLLIRTSGESRLSDFLLWQSAESVLCFLDEMWPEVTIWKLMAAIFYYQVHHLAMQKLILPKNKTEISNIIIEDSERKIRQKHFIDVVSLNNWNLLENEAEL